MEIRSRAILIITATNFTVTIVSILAGAGYVRSDVSRGLFITAFVSLLLGAAAAVIASRFIKKPFEELAALREAAETDSQAKSTFLAHMSHEIRTPLNTVVGLSELALDYGCPDDETVDRLEKIQASGLTILSIVNDILDISKIKSGNFDLFSAEYDTPSLINDIVTLNIVSIGEKPLAFKLDVDESLPGALCGDDLRVKQVFNNLLSNAFKYTNEGEVEWRVRHYRDGEDVWLVSSIRDTGIGIKPEDLRKLFSDYNQVDTKANRKVEGTGLGLAITKRLVNMMGGDIEVASEYGRGTTFRVRLRQGFVSETTIGKEVAENLNGLRYMLSKRVGSRKLVRVDLSYAQVLVVDDIATNLEVVKGMMKPYLIKIDCAMSGRQAIDLIRTGEPRYNAVFMDHMMPGMDGLEATRIIREEIGTDYAKNVPIIALTANAIVGNEGMFLSRGFQGFISKPIDTAKLDAVLRRWVRDREREKELLKSKAADSPENGNGGESAELLLAGIHVDGLDMDEALKRFSGDEEVLVTVLRSYAAGTRCLLGDLREHLAAEKLSDYAIAVHGIKGSSYGLCARETGSLAEELEKAARAGNLSAVRAGHGAFEKTAEKLLAAINEALAAIEAAANKPRAQAPAPELLRELREAARAFDMDRVDAAMLGLEAFRYEKGGKLVAWLREQVDGMAFEEIFKPGLSELQAWAGQAADGGPPEGEKQAAGPDFTAPDAEILIVDDNETNLKAALAVLKPLQARLGAAQSGEEALRRLRGKRYHLILMDHLMPVMDGLEAAERLRRTEGYQNVPVIALTADETPGLKERFLAAGVNDFAAKPIDMEEIRAKLRRWLPGELIHEQAPRDEPAGPGDGPETQAGLPVIEGIDSEAGIRCSGTKEIFISLLGNVYSLIDLKSANLEKYLAGARFRDLAIEAHALRNTARMIGAGELSEAFGRLELYGNSGDREALERETPEVLRQYRAFKPRLAPFGETAEEERRAAPGEEAVFLLRRLQSAMDDFDLDGADEAMKQLERLRMPEGCRADLETLRAHVADAALDEVMEFSEIIIKTIERLEEDQG